MRTKQTNYPYLAGSLKGAFERLYSAPIVAQNLTDAQRYELREYIEAEIARVNALAEAYAETEAHL